MDSRNYEYEIVPIVENNGEIGGEMNNIISEVASIGFSLASNLLISLLTLIAFTTNLLISSDLNFNNFQFDANKIYFEVISFPMLMMISKILRQYYTPNIRFQYNIYICTLKKKFYLICQ